MMLRIIFFLALLSIHPFVNAQSSNYPAKTIRLIVPFEPGGSTDITARILADELGKSLGQSIIVENLGGSGGSRGTEIVARANPDGYTLLWANVAPIAINQHLYKNLPYDPAKSFSPITLATVFPNVLVVQPGMKAEKFKSFLAKSKNEFKSLSYGSAGNGSSTHLAGAWLNTLVGSDWLHVPFKGGAPALLAVASGQVDMYFSAVPSALPFIKAGKVFPLATTGKMRDASLPDVPTIAEMGFPQFDVVNWNGLLAPANTPSDVIEKLSHASIEALSSTRVKARLAAQGAVAAPMTPKEFSLYITKESIKWGNLVKIAHATIE
jgi:tripartite-type tricarboxylate transporter receptor subunit TctC